MTQRPVLYLVACAAPPALRVRSGIEAGQDVGWDVCLILTPSSRRWLADDIPALEKLTGHPVRSEYKMPREEDVLPPADAMLVAPATSNTINKWASGISDTLALGLVTEAIGLQLPLTALPYCNNAQAAHPAFARSVEVLGDAGVTVMLGAGGFTPHPPGQGDLDAYPWAEAVGTLIPRVRGGSSS
ncbi:flavoprotein [Streptomyces kaniharaensis]|uniref:Flavoprotein n=1 Tax=Streptomyces kaniharaensis TaxID=212423 RepID=A0A6N7L1I9_9ACTN|nr:flavoprotein [Streptomyces kaniharaensis]MQS17521.1 flavoprotein [Streptomyces kaniharaensis]